MLYGGFSAISSFRNLLGVLEGIPADKGDCCMQYTQVIVTDRADILYNSILEREFTSYT